MSNIENREKLEDLKLESIYADLMIEYTREKLAPIAAFSDRLTLQLKAFQKRLDQTKTQIIQEQNKVGEMTETVTDPAQPIPS